MARATAGRHRGALRYSIGYGAPVRPGVKSLAEARVAVVVPAYDEAERIVATLRGIPAWVRWIFVVDDASRDGTAARAEQLGDPRVRVVRHAQNRGVGAAIVTGYRLALEAEVEVAVVMAGDGQMDPEDLPQLVAPVLEGSADYVKGNRFQHPAVRDMPWPRRVAGAWLARATRLTTGLPIDDSQCGYTAIGRHALACLPLDELWPRYGYPNDLLGLLAAQGLRVAEVPVRPVYAGERSGIRYWHAALVLGLLVRRWWRAPPRPRGWTQGEAPSTRRA